MRWLVLAFVIYLLPVVVQPGEEGGQFWSLALADDDDDDGDDGDGDDDGDDDGGDDDDRGGRAEGGGSGGRGDGGGDPFTLIESLFGDDDDDDVGSFIEDEIVGIGLDPLDIAALELVGFRLSEEHQLGTLGLTVSRIAVPQGLDTSAALALARATRPAGSFDFNHLYQNTAADCASERCWSGHLVRFEWVALASCTEGQAIAMIDTAVDARHPVLRGADLTQRGFRPAGSEAVSPGHGTAIAAILVSQAETEVPALIPRARLFAADVFYRLGGAVRTDALTLLQAIDWAVESQARVIALSLSGEANDALQRGIREASRRAALVAAAGNGGPEAGPAYPAAYPEVMAVTAVDARKRHYRYANRGGYLDLAAPGVDVWSVDADGGYTTWSGTSFAVPFAAAALLHTGALNGGDPLRARRELTEAAEDLGALGRDDVFGWGLLQAPRKAC